MTEEKKLLVAAANAAAMITGFYEWVDRVEAAGGTTSISGIAACHAMLTSMKKNKKEINEKIIDPINELLKEAQSDD